jgi:signal transduction histidine kinase
VTVESNGERPRLVVDDEGPGVPPGERERIFSRFYRGGGQIAVRTRGAGIGLAVVSDLAEEIGATVRVGDSPAGGARFEVTFRTRPADLTAEEGS